MNNLDKNDLEYIKRELTALQGNLEQGKDLVIFDTKDNNIYIMFITRVQIGAVNLEVLQLKRILVDLLE